MNDAEGTYMDQHLASLRLDEAKQKANKEKKVFAEEWEEIQKKIGDTKWGKLKDEFDEHTLILDPDRKKDKKRSKEIKLSEEAMIVKDARKTLFSPQAKTRIKDSDKEANKSTKNLPKPEDDQQRKVDSRKQKDKSKQFNVSKETKFQELEKEEANEKALLAASIKIDKISFVRKR